MTKEVFSRVLDYNTGLTGASVLSALTIKYGAFQGFICQDYTVVQVITDAQGNDVTAQMGLRGVTLSPGIYISMASGDSIYSIILSSGSIILYDLGADMSSVPGVSDLITAFSTRASVDGAILESTSCINGPLMPYFKKASFYLTPSAYKEGKLYAQKPITGNGDLTWTRGSDAFRTNSSGLVQRMPWNLVPQSNTFNTTWALFGGATITSNSTTSPDGSTNATTLNSAGGVNDFLYQSFTVNNATTYTVSFFVKNVNSTQSKFYIPLTATPEAFINWSGSTLTSVTSSGTNSFTAMSNGWYRVSVTVTATATGVYIFRIYSDNNNTSKSVYIYGAQLVEGTTAQTYLPTTDRLGFPRLDYTYGTCPAALLEPQRTNLALYSDDFSNAWWSKSNTTVTTNTTTSPDGSTNADTVDEGTASGATHRLLGTSLTITAGAAYTISVYAKKNTMRYIRLSLNDITDTFKWFCGQYDLDNGTITTGVGSTAGSTVVGSSMTSVGNGWYRCTLTGTMTTTTAAFPIIYASDGSTILTSDSRGGVLYTGTSKQVYLYGAQLEAGAYPTTYIPTTSATVTRVADSFSRSNVYTNGLISAAGGTWFVDLKNTIPYTRDTFAQSLFIGGNSTGVGGDGFAFTFGGTTANRPLIRKYVGAVETLVGTLPADNNKVIIKWNGSTADVFANGTKITSATPFTFTNLQFLGGSGNAAPVFIQQMALFPAPLTDTECAAMTTI